MIFLLNEQVYCTHCKLNLDGVASDYPVPGKVNLDSQTIVTCSVCGGQTGFSSVGKDTSQVIEVTYIPKQ